MKNVDNPKIKNLSKDIKRLIINSLILLVGIGILSFLNAKTDFLLKASKYFMNNFVG